ncbi:hypothetical protein [Eggerthella lenta]|uniref:hypothetical protein n=1 Tax=Eggerthella lenta TaxID=84112 RepID=UPI001C69D918|nr:hypothetical protein [Eggerthella lenta]
MAAQRGTPQQRSLERRSISAAIIKRNEVSFSALTPQEEKQLYTVDKYFANEDEETFCAGGLKITAKLLADAMHSLPDEKRRTVLYRKTKAGRSLPKSCLCSPTETFNREERA